MANICDFDTLIVGKSPENIMKLYHWLSAEYLYGRKDGPEVFYIDNDGNEIPTEHHIGWRVGYDGGVESSAEYDDGPNLRDDGMYELRVWGTCAWSVASCMIDDGELCYMAENKDEKYKAISIEDATKELDLKVEIFSSETGFCFAEHFVIDRGEFLENECCDFYEVYVDAGDTYDDYLKKCEEYGTKPLVDKEAFESAKDDGSSRITVCDILDDEGFCEFTI